MFWNNKWKELISWMQLQESINRGLSNEVKLVENKLNLILDHLSLEYVPESEKKEPAKLVEKKFFKLPEEFGSILNNISRDSGASGTLESSWTLDMAEIGVPPKKKRSRPKKKK